jgi:hypothetical protein
MKKNDFLFGFALMVIAAIFTITGCDNPAGNGKEDTVSKEQLFADV